MAKKPLKKASRSKPGPAPEVLKLDGDWRDAVKRSFQAKRPVKAK